MRGLGTKGGFKIQIQDRANLGYNALYEATNKELRPLVDGAVTRILADRERVSFEPTGTAIDLFEVRAVLARGLEALDVDALEDCCKSFRGEVLEGLELDDCFGFAHWLAGEREKARNLHTQLLASLTSRLLDSPERALEHDSQQRVACHDVDHAGPDPPRKVHRLLNCRARFVFSARNGAQSEITARGRAA